MEGDLLGDRRLHLGERRRRGRRRGERFRRDRIRYGTHTPSAKPSLTIPPRRAPAGRAAVRAVGLPALGAASCSRARRAPRPHRRAPAAEHPDPSATSTPTESSVHPPAAPDRGLDSRGQDRHRDPRRARSPMRSPRRPGSDHPGLHLLRRLRFYVVTGLHGDDDVGGSSGREFVRSQRSGSGDDTRALP